MNDCILRFMEPEFLSTILSEDVILRFHKVEDRSPIKENCKR